MKTLLLLIVVSAAALAQVPAHSVVGSLTIDVADIQIPVPYGPAETRAVVTACSMDQVTAMWFNVLYGSSSNFYAQLQTVVKTDSGYCGAIVAPVERKNITSLSIDQNRTTEIKSPPAAQQSESPSKVR